MRQHKKHLAYSCSFCQKDHQQVLRLIAGPKGIYICNTCVVAYAEHASPQEQQKTLPCSFCGRTQMQSVWESKQGVRICDQCIALCEQIIAEENA